MPRSSERRRNRETGVFCARRVEGLFARAERLLQAESCFPPASSSAPRKVQFVYNVAGNDLPSAGGVRRRTCVLLSGDFWTCFLDFLLACWGQNLVSIYREVATAARLLACPMASEFSAAQSQPADLDGLTFPVLVILW